MRLSRSIVGLAALLTLVTYMKAGAAATSQTVVSRSRAREPDIAGILKSIDRAKASGEASSDTARLLQTPLFRLVPSGCGSPRSTALLQEWRSKGTVEGLKVSGVPGAQAKLSGVAMARIVGAYRYPLFNGSLLFPSVYLSQYGFDKALLIVEPQWPLDWYRKLLDGVGDKSLLVVFDSPLGEPDFDGIKAFFDESGAKVWAVAPAGRQASNDPIWPRSYPGVTMKAGHELTIDPGYTSATAHIWAVTNYINQRWPELPVCVFFAENRYTNLEFAQALQFAPSAILLSIHVKYGWGSGKLSPDPDAMARFRVSARQALAQFIPTAPIILHGQVVSYRNSNLTASRTDTRLKQEAPSVFTDARDQGYAAACLILE